MQPLRLADDLVEALARVFVQGPLLAPELRHFAVGARKARHRRHRRDELGVVPGFHDEVRGAFAHRVHGRFDAAVSGHQDDLGFGREGLRGLQPVEAFLAGRGAGGEIHVEQDDVERVIGEEPRDPRGIGRRHDISEFLLQDELGGEQHFRIVVDDQQVAKLRRRGPRCQGR